MTVRQSIDWQEQDGKRKESSRFNRTMDGSGCVVLNSSPSNNRPAAVTHLSSMERESLHSCRQQVTTADKTHCNWISTQNNLPL